MAFSLLKFARFVMLRRKIIFLLFCCDLHKSFGLFIDIAWPLHCDMNKFLLIAFVRLFNDQLKLLCVFLWKVWLKRNRWVHEKTCLDEAASVG